MPYLYETHTFYKIPIETHRITILDIKLYCLNVDLSNPR